VLPASQRAACPTKPCASVPDTPGNGVPLVEGVVVALVVDGVDVVVDGDGETVSVVVLTDGGVGTAIVVEGGAAVSWSPENSCIASTTATPNSTTVATTSATWLPPNRDFRAIGAGIADGGYGV
jgi:hypothetical protein